jgi:hypothetical protein
MGITAYGPLLHTIKMNIGPYGFRRLVVHYTEAPVRGYISQRYSQMNSYVTNILSVLPGPLLVQAPDLDLHTWSVRKVHSTLISEFSIDTHKSGGMLKPWDRTMVTANDPSFYT